MITNSKQFPKRYFGMHFAPGVAQYKDPGSEPYKVFLNQDTINRMDPSFEGKHLYVGHRETVQPTDEADGYIVKSFFNQVDGKQWVEFLVTSDSGHAAIAKGWKLSNAYVVKSTSIGGTWHGVPYSKEIMDGEYEHLALVPDPRYAESVIMTPEEFKQYNAMKDLELKKLSNSKEQSSMFELFKKVKIENTAEFYSALVTLPKSGLEKTVSTLINEADEAEEAKKDPSTQMANDEHGVMFGEKRMKVGELVSAHQACMNELTSMKAAADEAKKAEDEKKANALAEAEKLAADEKVKNSIHADAIKNAEANATKPSDQITKVSSTELGKSLFGSK